MRGQDQMPESLERTKKIEVEKLRHTSGGELIQATENPVRTDDIEKAKRERGGSL